jgi:prephenate dehydrogenase
VLSPLAPQHPGFSAGSYRDVSRVARINGEMWSELFVANKEPLIREIDDLVSNLETFKEGIEKEDFETLERLMAQANKIKEEIG